MKKTEALPDAEIARQLAETAGWSRVDNAIARTYRFRDFKEAMVFVNAVAKLAELENHHPDITIRYRDVTIAWWTHDAGGVTARDVSLARKLNDLSGITGPFAELIAEKDFATVEQIYDPRNFGNAVVALESKDFRLRFVRDRGDVFVEVAALASDDWHYPGYIFEFLSKDSRWTDVKTPPALETLARGLREHYADVRRLFEDYRSHRAALKKFEKAKFEQRMKNARRQSRP